MSEQQSTRVLRLPEVKAATGLSRSTIYDRISRGEFPAPINLGRRAVGWLEHEISGWLRQRVAESRGRDQLPGAGSASTTVVTSHGVIGQSGEGEA